MRPALAVLRDLGLGDFLTGVPALRALRRAFPEHRLVLVAPSVLAPLARRSGAVDALAAEPPRGADVAVNLHGRGPESHARLAAARPGRLIAFASAGHPGPEWRPGEHEVHRWCRLLETSGIAADPRDLLLGRGGHGSATVIHPGAASGSRRWPAERWAAVARAQPDVVITGSAGERALAETVARRAGLPEERVLAGRTDLAQLADVIAGARRVYCGDTGVAHLATAFGTPSVVLFGPTPPAEWGPPVDRPQHVALYRGGRGDPHGDSPDPGLLAITVDDVMAAAPAQAAAITSTSTSQSSGSVPTAGRRRDGAPSRA